MVIQIQKEVIEGEEGIQRFAHRVECGRTCIRSTACHRARVPLAVEEGEGRKEKGRRGRKGRDE